MQGLYLQYHTVKNVLIYICYFLWIWQCGHLYNAKNGLFKNAHWQGTMNIQSDQLMQTGCSDTIFEKLCWQDVMWMYVKCELDYTRIPDEERSPNTQ